MVQNMKDSVMEFIEDFVDDEFGEQEELNVADGIGIHSVKICLHI